MLLLSAAAFAFDVSSPACEDERVTFTSTEPEAHEWAWTIDGVYIGDEPTAQKIFTEPGTFPALLEMDTSDGPKSESADVEVFRVPEVTLAGPVAPAAHEHVEYLATSPESVTWSWAVEGGTLIGDVTGDRVEVEWGESEHGRIEVYGLADSPCPGVEAIGVDITLPAEDSGAVDTGEVEQPQECGCASFVAGSPRGGAGAAVGVALGLLAVGRRRRSGPAVQG